MTDKDPFLTDSGSSISSNEDTASTNNSSRESSSDKSQAGISSVPQDNLSTKSSQRSSSTPSNNGISDIEEKDESLPEIPSMSSPSEGQVEPQVTPKITPQVEPKVEPKVAPEVEPKVEPQVTPKVTSEVDPKVTSEVEPKVTKEVEPKVEPQVTPKVTSEVEPKVTSEVEPKVTSEVEPKVTSEVEPKVTSEVELQDSYNLKKVYEKNNCSNIRNIYDTECNKFLLKKEELERIALSEEKVDESYLYPNLNDPNFNIKIANKREFYENKYEGTIHEDFKKHADDLAKIGFESIQPHQAFVKNFMSFQTPYSSLLLFHGLGSGKTCSAIGVCEEMRDYMKQMGINKRIIIVASENVQDNFRLQLFDERKLKEIDGIWNIKGCVGNKLIKEINPMNMKGLPREKVISQIKNLINTYYIFLGYVQFANYIIRTINNTEESKKSVDEGKKKIQTFGDSKIELSNRAINRLRNEFDGRLFVIDEVHNIRKTEDNENKKVAINLEILVKCVVNMRFLLLSATPMYNTYKEIIWLLNLMNTNDRRGRIEPKDVFDKNGDFKNEGKELLIRKATGYISFVRGENPYIFPYRIYPEFFAKNNTFFTIKYPKCQMNLKEIKNEVKDVKPVLNLVYLTQIGGCNDCGKCQYCCYRYIIYNLRNKQFSITTKTGIVREMPNFENMESFGYTLLQTPLESLIISYPVKELKNIIKEIPRETNCKETEVEEKKKTKKKKREEIQEKKDLPLIINYDTESEEKIGGTITSESTEEFGDKILMLDPHQLTGKKGLQRMMNFKDDKKNLFKGDFEYNKSTLSDYGKIFSQDEIGKYSAKIKNILDNILNPTTNEVSEGIILIYSQYIDSGLIPVALALEEMGFTRFGQQGIKPLFKDRPTPVVDVRTMKTPKDKNDFKPARYSMITGDPRLSPNNDYEVKGLTNETNKEGHNVKVVLISKAGSEGIDLKFIRQVHILEPWYNMNRIEQIIGRAVRNFSHKDLPFEKRNVQIFMYGTILDDNLEEAADLYVYRVAELKAIQIGKVTRVLKETAVDCIINHEQTKFTQEEINKVIKEPIQQELSTGILLDNFKIGDVPFSSTCDYMAVCNYDCNPTADINENNLNEDTYNENFIIMNSERIIQRIKMLMKESFFYKKDVLIELIRTPKQYPYIQIYSALNQLVEDENEFITDKYGRNGRLVNIGEYYMFQPIELQNKNASIFDRSVPIDYKHKMIDFKINQDIVNYVIDKRNLIKPIIDKEKDVISQGKIVFDNIKINYDTCNEFVKQPIVPRGDKNWYKHCGLVINRMFKEYPNSSKFLVEYLVAHIVETLLFNEKLELMNYIYSLENIEKGTFEEFIRKYFDKNILVVNNSQIYIMYKLNKKMVMVLENNEWKETEPEDEREINEELKKILKNKEKNENMYVKVKELLDLNIDDCNEFVGFIGYEKDNKNLIFKTKNMTSNRDTGAICSQAGKIKTMNLLNKIIGEEKYTNETTKIVKEGNKIIQQALGEQQLCVLQEFILRYFNTIKKDGKKWFLTPEAAISNKLYTIFVK